jgi:hypothetical protein
MVFHFSDQDLIPFMYIFFTKRKGYAVYSGCGAGSENDFVRMGCIYKIPNSDLAFS